MIFITYKDNFADMTAQGVKNTIKRQASVPPPLSLYTALFPRPGVLLPNRMKRSRWSSNMTILGMDC